MEWMNYQNNFLLLMIIRRYLKLTYSYCIKNNLIDKNIEELKTMELPFKIDFLPTSFPEPYRLILNINDKIK